VNLSEARAVQALLDWTLNLIVFEHRSDVLTDVLPDDEFVRVVGVLAARSHAALGAGLRQDEAIAAAMRMLGWADERPVEDLEPVDVPPNAGSSS
jgi:hypothetical protein